MFREVLPVLHENEVIIERSLSYFDSLDAPKRVYEFNSKIKLILIIVNPVIRVISYFTHRLSDNFTSNKQFSKLFESTILNKEGKVKENNKRSRISNNYFTRGKYSIHYKRWLKYFSKEQILVLNGENFKINPYEEIKKVEKFVNLKPYFVENMFIYNETKGFYCFNQNKETTCLGSDKGREHPFVSDEVKLKLKNVFKSYDEELFKLINQKPYW
jgi:hypothetical protein